MASMIRRDLFASVPALITAFFFVLISYAINMSPLFITISVVILLLLNLFHYDFHNSVYSFIVSLSISRKEIVLDRFIVTGSIAGVFVIFIWFFTMFADTFVLSLLDLLPFSLSALFGSLICLSTPIFIRDLVEI